MNVPLVDLSWQHAQISEEVSEGMARVIDSASFINGPAVGEFEEAFAQFMGASYCAGVSSGTDALEMAVRALGLGRGDKVGVPANSFIASALGVLRAGASVQLFDCDPDSYLLSQNAVVEALDQRDLRAIMPVHLYGQVAPVDEIRRNRPDILIIEDAAQSQGASRHGNPAGSLGHVAGTSFYPGKNIGAYGDAGAVLTNDAAIARRVRELGNWGSSEKYAHPVLGFNSRLDTIQAVVLHAKLKRLAEWNELRQIAAKRYESLLGGDERVALPVVLEGNVHVWHLYVVRIPNRDNVLGVLRDAGISAGIHYPRPMHLQGAISELGHGPGDFPVAEKIAEEVLSLPIFPGITEEQQEYVSHVLISAL